MAIKRTLAERDWEKENLEREVASCKNVTDCIQKEKEELEKEFANFQRELSSSSTALVHSNAMEENEQMLAAKQEAAHWEESYNCLVQEKEVFQNDVMELQDKLAGMQAEYEKSQRELMNCSKNYSIKVSEFDFLSVLWKVFGSFLKIFGRSSNPRSRSQGFTILRGEGKNPGNEVVKT